MYRILRIELKRALCNKFFYFSLIVTLIFCMLHFFDAYESRMEYLELCEYYNYSKMLYTCEGTPYDQWFLMDESIYKFIYLFIMPLLVTIPYGASYYQDYKSGYIKQIVTKVNYKKYMTAKYLSTFISAGLTAVIPMIIQFMAMAMIYPIHNPSIYVSKLVSERLLLFYVYYEQPVLYLLIVLGTLFICAGIFSTIALLVSRYISNYFSVIITPFIAAFFMTFLSYILGINELSPMMFLKANLQVEYNYAIPLVCMLVLFFASYIGFIKSHKEEVL